MYVRPLCRLRREKENDGSFWSHTELPPQSNTPHRDRKGRVTRSPVLRKRWLRTDSLCLQWGRQWLCTLCEHNHYCAGRNPVALLTSAMQDPQVVRFIWMTSRCGIIACAVPCKPKRTRIAFCAFDSVVSGTRSWISFRFSSCTACHGGFISFSESSWSVALILRLTQPHMCLSSVFF